MTLSLMMPNTGSMVLLRWSQALCSALVCDRRRIRSMNGESCGCSAGSALILHICTASLEDCPPTAGVTPWHHPTLRGWKGLGQKLHSRRTRLGARSNGQSGGLGCSRFQSCRLLGFRLCETCCGAGKWLFPMQRRRGAGSRTAAHRVIGNAHLPPFSVFFASASCSFAPASTLG